MHLTNWQYIA